MKSSLAITLLLLLAYSLPCYATDVIVEEAKFPVVVGETETTQVGADETLMEVALRGGLGYEVVANANRHIDPWKPGKGTQIILPGEAILPFGSKLGLTINLAELRLFHVRITEEKPQASVYPLGIGRAGRETPEGNYHIVIKKERPDWRVPEGLREQDQTLPEIVQPGPQNPLGDYWLGLSAPGYGVHGTNRPLGVGRRVSYGCMRMYPQDIATLYAQVETGTPVQIVYQPVKAAWSGNKLLLEVHPDYLGRFDNGFQNALTMISHTGWPDEIDYAEVQRLIEEKNGTATIINILGLGLAPQREASP